MRMKNLLLALALLLMFPVIPTATVANPNGTGQIITYRYDALGRLKAVEDNKNSNRTYNYDDVGNRESISN